MKTFVLRIVSLAVIMCFMTLTAFAADIPDGYIEAKGIAEPNQSYSEGVRAAELIAFRKLAQEIGEFPLDDESTVSKGLGSSVIKTRLHQVLRRVKVIDEGRQTDGYYYAVVRMPINGAVSVNSVVFDRNKTVEPLPKPKTQIPKNVSVPNGKHYTGVIIDCRGKKLDKVMSPVIKRASGEPIYGHKNLDFDAIVSNGMASYTRSTKVGIERAGSNPLIVVAVKVEGRVNLCNPVVSDADADKILAANQAGHFLEKCSVVFVY